jgi:hypothetical protein
VYLEAVNAWLVGQGDLPARSAQAGGGRRAEDGSEGEMSGE